MALVELRNRPQVLTRVTSTPTQSLEPREVPRDQAPGLLRILVGGYSSPRVVTTPARPKVKTDASRTIEIGQLTITQYVSGGVEINNKLYQQSIRLDEAQIDELTVALDGVLEHRICKVSKKI